jgi:Zinc-binding dehydrogenase
MRFSFKFKRSFQIFKFCHCREECIVRQTRWSSRWVRLLGDCRGDRVERPARSALDRRTRRWPGPWRLVILILSNVVALLFILRNLYLFAGQGPHSPGAFAEYLVTYADFVVHVPDNWSLEDAGQLGIAPFTALMALYDLLKFPEPHSIPVPPPQSASGASSSSVPILISGGASSVGLYTIQIAKHSGLYVIATASERNFDLVRSFGADVVVDYRDPAKAAKQIREAAPGPIEHALDCVSTGTSFELVAASLDGKGTIANLTLGNYPTVEGVKVINGIIFDYFGKVSPFPSSLYCTAANRKNPPLTRGAPFFLCTGL